MDYLFKGREVIDSVKAILANALLGVGWFATIFDIGDRVLGTLCFIVVLLYWGRKYYWQEKQEKSKHEKILEEIDRIKREKK